MRTRRRILSALDIGTTKAAVLCAEVREGDEPRVIGCGLAPCPGLNRGVPADMDESIAAVESAVSQAEREAGIHVEDLHLAISGAQVSGSDGRSVCIVTRNPRDTKSSVITRDQVQRVLEQACSAETLPIDRSILHALPREFLVDGVGGARNPVGINGLELEGRVHVLTAPVTVLQSLKRCVNRAGLNVASVTLCSLAASEAVLRRDELELGVALLDMGAGSTDLLVQDEAGVRHAATIPLGGGAVSRDITMAFRTPHEETEKIKLRHGCCCQKLLRREERFSIDTIGAERPLQAGRSQLCQVIQPRMEEILDLAEEELKTSDLRWLLGAGIVLTGGAALLQGLPELIQDRFALPVRLGEPEGIQGLDDLPEPLRWATAAGTLLHAIQRPRGAGRTIRWPARLRRIRNLLIRRRRRHSNVGDPVQVRGDR